jgi:enolase-phosphatase E1
VAVSLSALQTRALVLDVEGTTTPIEFVYQVLFPYARAHAAAYLQREGESAACRAAIEQLREERASDIARGEFSGDLDERSNLSHILAYVTWLMDRDRKSPGLKALQGLIWQGGFGSGQLRGQVYPDVPPAFSRWRASGRAIYIYSSGSVLAQRLLFGSTAAGDLTPFLEGHFDTAVGPKTSPASYRLIAERIGVAPEQALFVSDVTAELDAARAAGLRTALCVRGEEEPSGTDRHPVIRTFDEIGD